MATSDDAIYVGGKLTQANWLPAGVDGQAIVGRINVSNNMWAWQKQIQADDGMKAVTALSVDPSGSKLACHGMDWHFTDSPANPTSNIGYLFLLDTQNGAVLTSFIKMTHP